MLVFTFFIICKHVTTLDSVSHYAAKKNRVIYHMTYTYGSCILSFIKNTTLHVVVIDFSGQRCGGQWLEAVIVQYPRCTGAACLAQSSNHTESDRRYEHWILDVLNWTIIQHRHRWYHYQIRQLWWVSPMLFFSFFSVFILFYVVYENFKLFAINFTHQTISGVDGLKFLPQLWSNGGEKKKKN